MKLFTSHKLVKSALHLHANMINRCYSSLHVLPVFNCNVLRHSTGNCTRVQCENDVRYCSCIECHGAFGRVAGGRCQSTVHRVNALCDAVDRVTDLP